MRWFTRALLGSVYPGAPFERKFLAMLLLNTLVSSWNLPDKAMRKSMPWRCRTRNPCCPSLIPLPCSARLMRLLAL